MTLLYYKKEREDFPIEFGTYLDIKEADTIIRKLIRHYKLSRYNKWKFVGTESSRCLTRSFKNNPYSDLPRGEFKFSRKYTSIGVICHELAHAIEMTKYSRSAHAGRHRRIMTRIIKYCNKQGYTPGYTK